MMGVMKKTTGKSLQLRKSTIRQLQDSELSRVRGGEFLLLAPTKHPSHCSACYQREAADDKP
jgi:hypothetical protein